MRKILFIPIVVIIASFIFAVYIYPQMPEQMATHWNARGEVDGYMGRFWGTFMLPIVSAAMLLLLIVLPMIDPMKKNVDKFRNYFDWFIALITVFLVYMYVLSIVWNLGNQINIGTFMFPALGLLFFYMGILLEKAEMNWFIGIRNPWTLSSETVWKKTHQIGAKLFKISGVLALLGVFFPKASMLFVLVPVLASAIFTFIYSYTLYRKEKKK